MEKLVLKNGDGNGDVAGKRRCCKCQCGGEEGDQCKDSAEQDYPQVENQTQFSLMLPQRLDLLYLQRAEGKLEEVHRPDCRAPGGSHAFGGFPIWLPHPGLNNNILLVLYLIPSGTLG